jgi:hypothetical protein
MIRLIAAFILMLAPLMSVSTGTSEGQRVFTSHDLGDERGCTQGQTTNGCGGNPPAPFVIIEGVPTNQGR